MSHRVAVVFWGIARSLRHTISSIQSNVLQPLRSAGHRVSVCVHTYTSNKVYSNPWAKERPQMMDNTQHKLLNADIEVVEDQDLVWEEENLQQLLPEKDPWDNEFRQYKNFILAVRSKAAAFRAIQRLEADVVVFSRPDVTYRKPIEMSWIERCAASDHVVLGPCWQLPWGINDRFAICSGKAAELWSASALEHLKLRKCDTSEKQLFDCVTKHGAALGTIDVHFWRVRMGGERSKTDERDYQYVLQSKRARRRHGVGDRLRAATAAIRIHGTVVEITK